MTTQLQSAQKGIITDQMKKVASSEDIDSEKLRELIGDGKVVIPFNPKHSPSNISAIGKEMRVKINVNLGTSPEIINLQDELTKLKLACELNADAVMDLSTGGDLQEIRKIIIDKSSLPLGTVPAYEIFETSKRGGHDFSSAKASDFIKTVKRQAEEGVDFMTIHAGVNSDTVKKIRQSKRIMGIVSRGGALTVNWMTKNNKENPFFERYDEILDIAAEHDVTISLGDAFRPGATHDAGDSAQISELILLSELADRANQKGVQVIIEGPGHVPLNQIESNMVIQKTICKQRPFYVLGPLVCDIACGYDHMTSAIGGSIAAYHGADFLCYVTPAEHLRLPTIDDVRNGIIASKIAAFSADLARGKKYAVIQNMEMCKARNNLDWDKMIKHSIDPSATTLSLQKSGTNHEKPCTMCGDYCAIKINCLFHSETALLFI
ncbi:MAG: hypothetical protein COS89_01065 [Deltaproteobacteria bacterium CG07_land_8_20_14_0_80_38_7]|nr:MAG: hypothetical protein COS89_01065 [Deltaproteobacteria bacterium CG07_land_8_20_14_0_80_38_7]